MIRVFSCRFVAILALAASTAQAVDAPIPRRAHEKAALSAAIAKALTPEQVEAMTFRQIAVLAGVTVDAIGNVPATFFYESVRRNVANALRRQRLALLRARRKAAIEAAVAANADLTGVVVKENPDGTLTLEAPK